jgi:hypothetical protein
MPNGNDVAYNQDWCKERHEKLDSRMDSLENKFWGIIILLMMNLSGIITVIYTGG